MASPTNLKLDGLDFEAIRDNLKTYLQSQDQFRDYNFDASGLAVMLDVLAYNTYYNSFYLNMVSTEAFLNTAQRRSSVVNLARSLNYTPRSTSSARLTGTISVDVANAANNNAITFPKYTKFQGTVEDNTYLFLTQESLTIFKDANDQFSKSSVTLVEGTVVSEKYIVNTADTNQRFIINNRNIDVSTLAVRVLNSVGDSTTRVFTRSDNIVYIDGTSQIYFIDEVEDGKYEVFFGDDTLGKALDNGNLIYFDYLISSGKAANEVQTVSYFSTIAGVISATFSTDAPSYGGDDRETIDRIKFNAPKSYSAQNRAVTAEDYSSILLNEPNVGSVMVWGGEDNDPPYYGKVFIAIKPKVGEILTQTEKTNLIEYVLGPKKVLTISNEIVDPDYIYLVLDVTVKYDGTKNTLNASSLQSLVLQTIQNYNNDDLSGFSKYFRQSRLSRLIDTCERSILNSNLTVRMRKEVEVQLGIGARYEIFFSNAIDNAAATRPASQAFSSGNKLSSNQFSYGGYSNCFMEDNGGLIRIYSRSGANYVGVVSNAGTIDYITGKIVLTNFNPDSFADGGNTLKLTAYAQNPDILPLRTQIVSIRDSDVTISTIDDNTISLTRR